MNLQNERAKHDPETFSKFNFHFFRSLFSNQPIWGYEPWA